MSTDEDKAAMKRALSIEEQRRAAKAAERLTVTLSKPSYVMVFNLVHNQLREQEHALMALNEKKDDVNNEPGVPIYTRSAAHYDETYHKMLKKAFAELGGES